MFAAVARKAGCNNEKTSTKKQVDNTSWQLTQNIIRPMDLGKAYEAEQIISGTNFIDC